MNRILLRDDGKFQERSRDYARGIFRYISAKYGIAPGLRPKCVPASLKCLQVVTATRFTFRLADHTILTSNEFFYYLKGAA